MLRNIAITGPYFHKGQIATLEETVRKMAWHQLGKELSEDQVQSLVTFLKTLTDKPRVPRGTAAIGVETGSDGTRVASARD